jgi:hypothetical protein
MQWSVAHLVSLFEGKQNKKLMKTRENKLILTHICGEELCISLIILIYKIHNLWINNLAMLLASSGVVCLGSLQVFFVYFCNVTLFPVKML